MTYWKKTVSETGTSPALLVGPGAGSSEQAVALLDLGCDLIVRCAPTTVKAFAAMTVLSRIVSSAAPAPRLRLRARILGRYVWLLPRLVAHAARLRRAPAAGDLVPAWEDPKEARHDARVLSDEGLEAFRALLASVNAKE